MSIARDLASGSGIDAGEVVPHIIPDVLYPAVAGKLLDGSTSHSGDYGTAQADGFSYYYTDIKGSKPIKDPRIGAYFGSQRHTFTSIQRLEQESVTHGLDVYSADGREWVRLVDGTNATNGRWRCSNNLHGVYLNGDGGSNYGGMFFEVTGYFNDINFLLDTDTNNNTDIDIFVNGTKTIDGSTTLAGDVTAGTPLGSRYVSRSSLINVGDASLGTTPAINTLKYYINSQTSPTRAVYLTGIELIAQDTTSTANKSKIQIPAQNVVSYGKKHAISATAQHYNPFDGMSGAKTLAQLGDYIDTATSLGMENWKGGTSNYHKPFNGGRVVKWVDSTGTIKTSVTMMPPNAQNMSATASNAVSNAHIIDGTNDDVINFDTTTIANATPLSEVAKTFHWREFGNGSANGNTTYADTSMLSSSDDIAYVMDDGLTSLSGDDVHGGTYLTTSGSDHFYITFIGTGFSWHGTNHAGSGISWETLAQNLPYGTHVVKIARDGSSNYSAIVDGVTVYNVGSGLFHQTDEVTFHQPKKPPIPEDAVVISDYMLMADFVGIPASTAPAAGLISKGTRFVSPSRDMFYNTPNNSFTFAMFGGAGGYPVEGSYIYTGIGTTSVASLPFFGVNAEVAKFASRTLLLIDAETSETGITNRSSPDSTWYNHSYKTTNLTPALYTLHHKPSGSNHWNHGGTWIATPIHTSSHYQPFETSNLYELVGGDRNMEQNNLIVTPDGKSWDQVTRDTSYMGDITWEAGRSSAVDLSSGGAIFDEYRGAGTTPSRSFHQKDFAIAYDKHICLRTGSYCFNLHSLSSDTQGGNRAFGVTINGTDAFYAYQTDYNYHSAGMSIEIFMKRGDYFQILGYLREDHYGTYQVTRVK